jgi:hypothetical protein
VSSLRTPPDGTREVAALRAALSSSSVRPFITRFFHFIASAVLNRHIAPHSANAAFASANSTSIPWRCLRWSSREGRFRNRTFFARVVIQGGKPGDTYAVCHARARILAQTRRRSTRAGEGHGHA